MKIGLTFAAEIIAVGLGGLPFSWSDDGTITGRENLTSDQNAALDAVLAAHNPDALPRRLVAKSTIIARLTDAQLAAAVAAMTPRQLLQWNAADKPAVYADDAGTVTLITAIGADPAVVLAD